MNSDVFRQWLIGSLTAIAACGLMLLGASCKKSTTPPPPPPAYTLDIYPLNGIPEADINTNFYLGGRLNDSQGNPEAGRRVYFTLDQNWMGTITPWATTAPDSVDGFVERVVFHGDTVGVALIQGYVENIEGQELASDTLSIWVRDPING